MKKQITLGVLFWSLASLAGAAVLQDWSQAGSEKHSGVYSDKAGSTITMTQAEGPKDGEKGLQLDYNIKQWAGVWVAAKADLSGAGAIRFMAKSETPVILQVGLMDDKDNQSVASVRVVSSDWEEFVLPLSYFTKTRYPMPKAPKNGKLNLGKIVSMQFQPQTNGVSSLTLGPLSSMKGKAEARTGLAPVDPKRLVVQDFSLLEKNAYGPFADTDTGTTIEMGLVKDPDNQGALLGDFQYTLKTNGWCGYWIRAGQDWSGQDWTGAKTLTVEVYSQNPVQLQFGFKDAAQNSYTVFLPSTKGGGWESVSVPFSEVALDKYYQASEAKKGAALDLSRIETFNLAPATHGTNEFKVREVLVLK